MNARVNANLIKELKSYGVGDWNACFHCGNCTAICPLTEQGYLFPRRGIRSMQMGLADKLETNVDPWLCYYCGECSDTCPRDANPGEMMMSLRRYLTASYDWTGLSAKMYKSATAHIVFMIFLFCAVMAAFFVFADFSIPLNDQGVVQINEFAPWETIAFIDDILLAVLSFFLLSNIFIMFWRVVMKDKTVKIPIWLYVKEAFSAGINFLTQLRFSKCERKVTYWISHLLMVSSYFIMFTLIVFFLGKFQTEDMPGVNLITILGYYTTFGFLFSTIYFSIGRFRKKEQVFKFSHHSDWVFIFLLFMIAFTGILIHIFRINGLAQPTYFMYALHLAFEVPMVVTFVAFSKWSHLAYRPFAIYFSNLKKSARAILDK